ncbi:hypothetical protein EV426DRAFT_109365 [Tirmania nivea]|nr:hypothetical protein EV426DRAFT_109365 [Tirmania nivea]
MSGDVVAVPVSAVSVSSAASGTRSRAAITSPSPLSIPAHSPRPTPPISTPTSGTCALAPKSMLQQSPIAAGDHGGQMGAGIVTQKEWVIPPRPKPGRKPATDTPPTKRKAQNRAAQRAFRERRAARVNELEDKIKDIEAEHAGQQLDAHQEIERLRIGNAELVKENLMWKGEVEKLRGEVKEWSEKAKGYLEEVEKLKREREVEKEMAMLLSVEKIQQVASPPSETEHEGMGMGVSLAPDVVPLPPRRSLRNKLRGGNRQSASTFIVSSPAPTTPSKSAKECMKDASGACPCRANSKVTSPEAEPQLSSSSSISLSSSYDPLEVTIHSLPKRSTSPSTNPPDKRTRLNATLPSSTSIDELETDFTAIYASGGFTSVSASSSSACMMADPCGFCSDGTPCVCAEMAMMEQRVKGGELGSRDVDMAFGIDAKLPPLQLYEIDEPFGAGMRGFGGMGVMHPPNGTRAAMLSSAARDAGMGGCGAMGGPGSCGLCQKDPLAMLFCQSVASRRADATTTTLSSSSSNTRPGCCGGSILKSGGGCCKTIKNEPCDNSSNTNLDKLPPMLPPSNSIYIPCSAAYQTLARHRAFEKASMDDFPGLVRPLVIDGEGGQEGCPKVEVGSLRDVLKMLDRRFGKGVA